jgi:hypothetical protein
MVWEFNEALTLSHVRSMTFMVSSFTWYNQLVVHINAPIFFFFLQSTIILNPAILLRHHLLRLIIHTPRSSTLDAINQS